MKLGTLAEVISILKNSNDYIFVAIQISGPISGRISGLINFLNIKQISMKLGTRVYNVIFKCLCKLKLDLDIQPDITY